MRRRRYTESTAAQVPIEGIAGDSLAAYIAEGLIPATFVPTGETETEIRTSIETRAFANWMKTPRAKNETFLLSAEETRLAFLKRNCGGMPTVDQDPEVIQRFMLEVQSSRALGPGLERPQPTVRNILPRGDAWEEPEPAEDVPPPMEE